MKKCSASRASSASRRASRPSRLCRENSFTCLRASTAFRIMWRLAMLVMVRYQLLYAGWRGYLIAWFALVWVANFYMSCSTGCGWISSTRMWRLRWRRGVAGGEAEVGSCCLRRRECGEGGFGFLLEGEGFGVLLFQAFDDVGGGLGDEAFVAELLVRRLRGPC